MLEIGKGALTQQDLVVAGGVAESGGEVDDVSVRGVVEPAPATMTPSVA